MEILATEILKGGELYSWLFVVGIALVSIAGGLLVVEWETASVGGRVALSLFLIFAFVFLASAIMAMLIPNGQMRYTVELTDNSYFHWFFEHGYTVEKKLFENRDIYNIVGVAMEGV